MVGHDDICVQEELPLTVVVAESPNEQLCGVGDLKEPAASGRHGRDQIRSDFLRRSPHVSSINERPAAKAASITSRIPGT